MKKIETYLDQFKLPKKKENEKVKTNEKIQESPKKTEENIQQENFVKDVEFDKKYLIIAGILLLIFISIFHSLVLNSIKLLVIMSKCLKKEKEKPQKKPATSKNKKKNKKD